MHLFRCTAFSTNLDDTAGSIPRTHAHTDVLVSTGDIELRELWDDYGIVGDIIVSFTFRVSDSPLTFLVPASCSQPFTMAFPRADIHEILAPDLLHQVIKGAFKDHIVTWVEKYINDNYIKAEAERILANIDRRLVELVFLPFRFSDRGSFTRIAVVPSFPGLRHFYQGRGFKQWTGDDSKGLMKVCFAILP